MSKFNVGDDVYDLRYGNGKVIELHEDNKWGVVVEFNNNIDIDNNKLVRNYKHGGEGGEHWANPMLYHGHDLKVVVKEKEYVYQVLYKRAGQGLWNTSAEFYSSINDWRDAVLYSGEEAEAMFLEVSKREINDD